MRIQSLILTVSAFAMTGGCYRTVPPAPATLRAGTPVAAPFARTWLAAVDAFADKNMGIRTIDRSSGLIVADPVDVPANDAGTLADCGAAIVGDIREAIRPTSATYNVRVRATADSTSSIVLVTVRFVHVATSPYGTAAADCSSTGAWETAFESAVKAKAETRGASH